MNGEGSLRRGDIERRWAEAFVDYLLSIGSTDQFFWCMNPNSGKVQWLSHTPVLVSVVKAFAAFLQLILNKLSSPEYDPARVFWLTTFC